MQTNKEKIRIAELRGKGTFKRCRKIERLFVEGIGLTDAEAIQNLKQNVEKQISKLREYAFDMQFYIFDAEREKFADYEVVTRGIMPYVNTQSYNTVYYDFDCLKAV